MIRTIRLNLNNISLNILIKPAIILAILLLSAYLGRRASPRIVWFITLAVVGGLSVLLLTKTMKFGLLVLILISFFVHWELGSGTNISINGTLMLAAFLVGIWLFSMLVIEQDIRLVPSRVNKPAIAFIIATTVSLIAGNINWIPSAYESASFPAQLGAYAIYVLSVGMLLFVGNRIYNIKWLRYFTWLFLAVGGIYILIQLIPSFNPFAYRIFVGGSLSSIFITWTAAMALGQALFNNDLRLSWRIPLLLLAGGIVYLYWILDKEFIAGWLPPLIALWVITWLRSWKFGLIVTITGLVMVIAFFPNLYSNVYTPTQQYSTMSRSATWPIMWELIKANPILGLGPANYYYYTPLYSLLGWFVNFNSHNNYIDIIAQTGFVGFGIFLWLIFELGRLGFKLRNQVSDFFSKGYVNGVIGGLIGALAAGFMADWFLPFLYNIGIPGFRSSVIAWIFLGGLISIETILRSQQSKPA